MDDILYIVAISLSLPSSPNRTARCPIYDRNASSVLKSRNVMHMQLSKFALLLETVRCTMIHLTIGHHFPFLGRNTTPFPECGTKFQLPDLQFRSLSSPFRDSKGLDTRLKWPTRSLQNQPAPWKAHFCEILSSSLRVEPTVVVYIRLWDLEAQLANSRVSRSFGSLGNELQVFVWQTSSIKKQQTHS